MGADMKVLVVGGAGYIGSHMVKYLGRAGCNVVTLDNLSGGYQDAVLTGDFVEGDLANRDLLENLFSVHAFDVVMHFASFIQVGESVRRPDIYYRNNVVNSLNLLDAMVAHGVHQFIFSSTAAIFGEPEVVPIDEQHTRAPINPYGRSKWMLEQMLEDYDRAFGLKSVCLRYFNAAGADPDGDLGERHQPETHLIPLVLQVASGRRESITVFGNDYDTPDGTCIRDYVHIADLCEAHWRAVQYLNGGGVSRQFNLGNGSGFSVRQVIDVAHAVTGKEIATRYVDRREGDPARLVADATMAREILGWVPKYPELSTIVSHAWQWEQSFFNGSVQQ